MCQRTPGHEEFVIFCYLEVSATNLAVPLIATSRLFRGKLRVILAGKTNPEPATCGCRECIQTGLLVRDWTTVKEPKLKDLEIDIS